MPCLLPMSFPNQGSFPPPALPGFLGNTSPSATLTARPAPHGVPVGACHTTDRASRVATLSIFHACHSQCPGETDRCSRRSPPDRCQPSPFYRRVGFRITRFEACSAFTHVAARMLAEPPKAALFHRSASNHVVTSVIRSDCYRLERQLPGGVRTR